MTRLRSLVVGGLVLLSVGCTTTRQTADRALESEDYDKALVHYKEVIEEGTNDWEVYYNAAKAANHRGNFSLAEKYYGQALRHGGGVKVVRELADFYIKTSNYSRAVRLLQFLLETDADKQTVYNNLGTALMYAEAPFDAESYLLLAQQLNPEDPVPYVNLGVLYERHLNNPALALGFYRCYLEYAEGDQQRRSVAARVQQLRNRFGSRRAAQVECGEPYRPGGATRSEIRTALQGGDDSESSGEEGADDSTGSEAGGRRKRSGEAGEQEPIDLSFDESETSTEGGGGGAKAKSSEDDASSSGGSGDDSEGGDSPQPKFEGVQVVSKQGGAESKGSPSNSKEGTSESGERGEQGDDASRTSSKESKSSDTENPVRKARHEYERGNYEAVVEQISDLSVDQMGPEATRLFGMALAELGEFERARRWLDTALRESPTPDLVRSALVTYGELDASSDVERVCRKFSDREPYEDVLEEHCPDELSPRELDKEAIEKYRESMDR